MKHHAPQTWIYNGRGVVALGPKAKSMVNLDSQRYSTSEELQRKLLVIAQLLHGHGKTWKAGEND